MRLSVIAYKTIDNQNKRRAALYALLEEDHLSLVSNICELRTVAFVINTFNGIYLVGKAPFHIALYRDKLVAPLIFCTSVLTEIVNHSAVM